jgi:hypothetical protein
MPNPQKHALFGRLRNAVSQYAPVVADTARNVAKAPANKSHIQNVDAAVLEAMRAGKAPDMDVPGIANKTIASFLANPEDAQRLMTDKPGHQLSMFLRGELPGATLPPHQLGQLQFKGAYEMTPYEQGYNAFMKVALLEDLTESRADKAVDAHRSGGVVGGALGGLAGAARGALKGRGGALEGLASGAITGAGLGSIANVAHKGGLKGVAGQQLGGLGGAAAGGAGGFALGAGLDAVTGGRFGHAGKVLGGLGGLFAGSEAGARAGIRSALE